MPKVLTVPMGSKREEMQPQKTDLLGIHSWKRSLHGKMANYIDNTSNSVKDLSSRLLDPGRAFRGCIAMCLRCSSVISTW